MNNFKAYRWHCGTLYLLRRYNVPQTQVISGFLLTFITSIYSFLIYFETFFYDYDVTTLEIIHPITTRNYAKHPIKVLRNQNNIMLYIFVPNVFNKRNLPEILTYLCLTFNHAKESFLQKKMQLGY